MRVISMDVGAEYPLDSKKFAKKREKSVKGGGGVEFRKKKNWEET